MFCFLPQTFSGSLSVRRRTFRGRVLLPGRPARPGRCVLLAVWLPFVAAVVQAEDPPATRGPAPLVTLPTPTAPDRKAAVLFFLLPDCPISNAYAPEIKRIVAEYAKQDVAGFVVYVDPDLSDADARKHAAEFGHECPVLSDSRLELARQTGATVAPEAVVLGPDGRIRYRGRIDDLYVDYGKRRVQPSQRDVRDALDAVLAGRPVARERTKAIGCPIAQ